ncbi:nitrous oxide reductase family maturation protein NosD [Bizionia sediminis]|uniref:Nitrous oxide reductase family maturation protein NosD n=1 Tax=Bizionia sediminis TaxID=1737064 RepID=A0ABW5KPQ4_9FLAO
MFKLKHYLLTIFFILLLKNDVLAQGITVCNTCTFKTLKDGINAAKAHDTVYLEKGIYKETDIQVNKPLTIIGKEKPVLDGEMKGEILIVTADSVTLDGLTIKNVGTSYTSDYAAVRLKRVENFVVQNLILEQLFFGIYVERSKNGKVLNNTIIGDAVEEYNSGNGIQLWYSNNIEIDNNIIQRVRDGIYLEFSDDCLITNNISSYNVRYGLHFMFSNKDTYSDNLFEKNGAGVAVMFSRDIKMYRNIFRENWGTASYGLLLKEINDAEIMYNTFEENTIGINTEGSNRIRYENNNFMNNGWAIKVLGACYSNTFKGNNFLYNSFDMAYNSKVHDNEFDGNYWSEYTGYDLDKDGVGDVPYRPVKLFSYIVNRTPETIILLRSLFIDIIDFSEKVSPVFTPDNLLDNNPKIKKITW